MSKHNKVNRDRYTQRGRLTPDEAARERMKQMETVSTRRMEGRPPVPPKSPGDPVDADEVEDEDEAEGTPDDTEK